MMPRLKPDTLNGKQILRPVIEGGDGIPKLASSSVFHPPSIDIKYLAVPLSQLVEDETRAIIAMRAMTTSELRDRLYRFAKLVINNDKRSAPGG